ncbi:GspE/PulE family protein [Rhodoplanes sp. TEM]|uniref:GspE/PulE family protein n=1 Tax=Rhodoplanes tepidamans TaxID=200616 RepID=A0ABT5JCD7_RHOTP|nr:MULTISPECIES: GspE/PulE family protein [Rhodoplanes]MDC7787286.1 GspE/PulE family protein [Rhodoplanes tepidamans]MDC7985314.1 GspE/PulE family protein [Rhodoplanes sp. TEM]MDQ0357821.1 general secretion pathway protein E [Rhodoplanes tepidamans]
MTSASAGDFASHLVRSGRIADPQADVAAADAGAPSLRRLWEASDLGAGDFADAVAQFFALPRIALPVLMAAPPLTRAFSPRFLRELAVFPYRAADGGACLAVADPTDTAGPRAAEIVLGGPVALAVASFEDVATVLAERLGEDEPTAAPDLQAPAAGRAADDIDSLRDLASGAPVVRAVDGLFEKAVELRASDIHIGPFRTGLEVRMRVDGLLRPVPAPAGVLPQAIISRIKILAGLDIAERRLPQDGAARLRLGRDELDVRVAIMPTQHGESAVIRLLPRDRGLLSIDRLGLLAADRATLTRLLDLPHGMIVVTGPTGSGKTTTLATMLSILNEPTRKILTIEDPVEYEIRGIYQSQVKPSIGLTFAAALRAFVRQDPDVIMVGEVRDPETAHIAVHAALTGHLVLTTLHTDTAAAAVPRLLDLGVESFLLKSTLRAVVAQRLVRQLCDRCKRPRTLAAADIAADPRFAALGFAAGDTVHEPVGCERCAGAGYRGRVGVFEILTLSDAIREQIDRSAGAGALDRAAITAGMTTMLDDGIAKCRAGLTSPAEVLRVTTVR